jgi:hypothetical protein
MRFRVGMHSRPGTWKYYKGYVDVDAPTIHEAVSRAMKRLLTGAFPSRPKGSWIVDWVRINRMEFEAEESRSG